MKIKLFSFVIFVITAILFAVCLDTVNAQTNTINGTNSNLRHLRDVFKSYYPPHDGDIPIIDEPSSLFSDIVNDNNEVNVSANVAGSVYGGLGGIGTTRADGSTDWNPSSDDNASPPANEAGFLNYKVENNTVTINRGATIGRSGTLGNVTGGWSRYGAANNNTVNVNGSVRGLIVGGWVDGHGEPDSSEPAYSHVPSDIKNEAKTNRVYIDAGNTTRLWGNIYGAYTQGSIDTGEINNIFGNTVEINSGLINISGSPKVIAGAYSSLATNQINQNTVTINGGVITGLTSGRPSTNIYGGRGQSTSVITNNTVNINGGTHSLQGIYGGQNFSGSGQVSNNAVNITDNNIEKITADYIYGSYSNSTSSFAAVTGNEITIDVDGTKGIFGNVIGGTVKAGSGDVFTDNVLNKNDTAHIGIVRNIATLEFNKDESLTDHVINNANIGTLYTTASGSSLTGVTVNTNDDFITFNRNYTDTAGDPHSDGGNIIGSGSLTKTGTGTLAIEGKIEIAKDINIVRTDDTTTSAPDTDISGGTLQINDGGSIAIPTTAKINIEDEDGTLAFNRTTGVNEETAFITGAGKVVQRGTDSFGLTNTDNNFIGGTEIESGTLVIYDNSSYHKATDSLSDTQGFFTFTPGDNPNAVRSIVLAPSEFLTLQNTFRTAENTGIFNLVNLQSVPELKIQNVSHAADNGGAFYVAADTGMSVAVDSLTMSDNKADGIANDIYVANNGTLEFYIADEVLVGGGVDGAGNLALYATDSNENDEARFAFDSTTTNGVPTYNMNNTYVEGGFNQAMILDLSNNSTSERIVLKNTDSFMMNSRRDEEQVPGWDGKTAMLTGDGIVEAPTITVTNGMLAPTNFIGGNASLTDASTLTLKGDSVTLENFAVFSQVGYQGSISGQEELDTNGVDSIPTSNNDLLYIDTDDNTNSRVIIKGDKTNNGIFLRTVPGGSFDSGYDYLLVKSTNGFSDGINDIDTDPEIQDKITVYLDGINLAELDITADGPRGEYALQLGDDPSATPGGDMPDTSGNNYNIWLAHDLNSLTMDWDTGNNWNVTEKLSVRFNSKQESGSGIDKKAHQFLSGDKVHVSKEGTILLGNEHDNAPAITSGLVVGQDSDGINADVNVIFGGTGGIWADASSAFGNYIDDGIGDGTLTRTGKLQKYGGGTLTFENTGGNRFMEGIDLSGGTVAFNQANQLNTETSTPDNYADMTFVANTILKPTASVNFGFQKTPTSAINGVPIVINDNVTATFEVGDDATSTEEIGLFVFGNVNSVSGESGNITKTGDGVLQFNNNVGDDDAIGNTTVSGGKFRVASIKANKGNTTAETTYNSTGTFTVESGAELSGGGTVNASDFVINGKIASDYTVMAPGEGNMVSKGEDRLATFTLSGAGTNDGEVTFNNTFQFDYRFKQTNATGDDASNTVNDLLQLKDMATVTLNGGTINFMSDMGTLTTGDYLIIDSNAAITASTFNGDPNTGTVTGKLNGENLVSGTPRGDFEFELRDNETELWLTTDHNTLEMVWNGGDGTWSSSNWTSEQVEDNARDKNFFDGDLVYFKDLSDDYTVEVARTKTVSGMDVAINNNVTFTGTQGITAKTNDDVITGVYVENTDHPTPTGDNSFETTGKLVKSGTGTLEFANTNINTFTNGIDIEAGTVAFHDDDQITVGTGSVIKFTSNTVDNGTLEALETLTLDQTRTVEIENGRTGAFRADDDVTFTYTGAITGDSTTALRKTGYGVVVLGDSSTVSGFAGRLSAEEGYLKVVGAYNATVGTDVLEYATLLGTGTITGPTVIKTGGYLMPSNMTAGSDFGIPATDSLEINGTLTFEEGSTFWVNIAQSNAEGEDYIVTDENGEKVLDPDSPDGFAHANKRKSYADLVTVTGAVNIDPNAYLNVEIDYSDYWGSEQLQEDYNPDTSGHFTIIDGENISVVDENAQFILEHSDLPLGVVMMQGWIGNDYQLWFEVQADGGGGYGDICFRHNRVSIGEVLDWYVAQGNAPQNIQDIIAALGTDPAVICEGLDQIHGDLTSNAMFLAMKEPWRHPFNRLSLDKALANCAVSCDPCDPLGSGRYKRQMWGEFTARYEDTGYDNNAHGFTVNRYGVAVGVDQQISRYAAIGANFQYSDPILRQATGRVDVNDYEFGLYGLTRLTPAVEMKAYLGYAHQNYDFDRYVSFGTGATAINEQLFGETSGDSLSASVEFVRPIRWNRNVRLLPVMALDYEKAWMDGYRESAGLTSLVYDDASLERLMFRVGLGGDWKRDNLTLNSRLQYAVQLNDSDMPRMGVRFANGGLNQPTADIWGSRIGSDYINWGLGMNWQLSPSRLVYVNYDAKWYDRSTLHIGEAGVQTRW